MRHCYACARPEGPGTRELRPYGSRGQLVCYECAMATPDARAEAERQFLKRYGAYSAGARTLVCTPELSPVHCPSCERRIGGHTNVRGSTAPKEGDVSICYHCGAVSIFNEDVELELWPEDKPLSNDVRQLRDAVLKRSRVN